MASEASSHEHLDATDREVVFCHACSYEWYRDERGLVCPSCRNEFTEIVSLENDPRRSDDVDDGLTSSPPTSVPFNAAEDSDPEEADIDQHTGQDGVNYSRNTQQGEDAQHHNPRLVPHVERFLDVISTIGLPHDGTIDAQLIRTLHEATHEPGPRIHRTTWQNGNMRGSVMFYTTSSQDVPPRAFEPFQNLFSTALRGFGGPAPETTGENPAAGTQTRGGNMQGLADGLGELLSLFNSHAVQGDAVYTQEALDRIITNLMDAHPQSNAAPPATEQGLANLPRKKIEEKDLISDNGNVNCSICIDAMKIGEMALILPCKHSFHEECVVLWLKEHNTCPVCRAPMEESARTSSQSQQRGGTLSHDENFTGPRQGDAARHSSPGPFPDTTADRQLSTEALHAAATAASRGSAAVSQTPGNGTSPAREWVDMQWMSSSGPSRPPNQGQTRLNEAMRHISSQLEERERDRYRSTTTGLNYDTSRFQRRNSHSPTSPREPTGRGERSMRERSPSQSSRQADTNASDGQQGHGSSGGPLGWIRGRFSGGGSRG